MWHLRCVDGVTCVIKRAGDNRRGRTAPSPDEHDTRRAAPAGAKLYTRATDLNGGRWTDACTFARACTQLSARVPSTCAAQSPARGSRPRPLDRSCSELTDLYAVSTRHVWCDPHSKGERLTFPGSPFAICVGTGKASASSSPSHAWLPHERASEGEAASASWW